MQQLTLDVEPSGTRVAGVDEAGRGPLAGPVVAAAVILDATRPVAGLDDSKRLSAHQRQRLDQEIRLNARCFAIAQASVDEIDQLNILGATLLAMQRAVMQLAPAPQVVWVDGNRLPVLPMPARTLVRGDQKMAAIAAASILAKVYRDQWCLQADVQWPRYGFAAHKGYGTAAHLEALRHYGPCAIHRRSFSPVAAALATRQSTPPP